MGLLNWLIFIVFVLLFAAGAIGLLYQFRAGHAKSGMNDRYVWGLNIIGFFALSSMAAGALAIVSVYILFSGQSIETLATYPLFIMVSSVACGALIASQVLLFTDLGKPMRAINILLHPNFKSPLFWDFAALVVLTITSIVMMFGIIPIITGWGIVPNSDFLFKLWAAVTLIFALICMAVHSLFFLARVSAGYNSRPFSTFRVFMYSFYAGAALLVLLTTYTDQQQLFSTILLVIAGIVAVASFGEFITTKHEKEALAFLIIEGVIFLVLLGIRLVNLDVQIASAVMAVIVLIMLFVEKYHVVIGFQKLPTVPLPYSRFEKKVKYKPSAVEIGAFSAGITLTVVISYVILIIQTYLLPMWFVVWR